jgi:hypothetical protein
MKYGIKVPFDGVYIWVMANVEDFNEPIPELYDTEEEAKDNAALWGNKAKVVEWEAGYGN